MKTAGSSNPNAQAPGTAAIPVQSSAGSPSSFSRSAWVCPSTKWAPNSRNSPKTVYPNAPRFPKGAIIRTLLKDLPPTALTGPTLFHEHLSIDLPYFGPTPATPRPATATNDVDLMIREVTTAGQEGVACIVDGGHADMK